MTKKAKKNEPNSLTHSKSGAGSENKTFDFSGYATKVNIKCSDGRTIKPDAFKHMDGKKVPLVWQHLHNDPQNILGYAVLKHRDDGTYAYCSFNDTEMAQVAKSAVKHGDINSLSIHANELKQLGNDVIHGEIREVSLVLVGANPEAFIDNITIEHSDKSLTTSETEAIIQQNQLISLTELQHAEDKKEDPKSDSKTVEEVLATMTDEQKELMYAFVGQAVEMKQSANIGTKSTKKQEEDSTMKRNIFEKNKKEMEAGSKPKNTLTHAQLGVIIEDAKKCGSLKEAFLKHTVTYGIENIDYLFPDARNITGNPEFVKRDTDWVDGVINGTKHTPFSRIKTLSADITADDARAKGYITGSMKKEEFFALQKRITSPTTIYKKQKLDRDDLIDITEIDVVAWLKSEMRMMLDEEIARVVLIGDGREVEDEDKISETNIRPIYTDDALYSHKIAIPADHDTEDLIDDILTARKYYKGSGSPALYIGTTELTNMLLFKDTTGRRMYPTLSELASALNVSKIVEVPLMDDVVRDGEGEGDTLTLVCIMVNLKDYTIGADKGGAVSMFDDFDIDYNQYKYLIETRISGALTKPKAAIVFEKMGTEN